jgi:hypothetical protein
VRDIETIDRELRLVARAWRVAHHMGFRPSTVHIDELLDERSALTGSRRPAARGGGAGRPVCDPRRFPATAV